MSEIENTNGMNLLLCSDKKILASIAISLKRIADKLELSQKQPILMSAEEYAKYESQKNDQK